MKTRTAEKASRTKKQQAVEAIAQRVLSLETLETRNSDSLDFHEHSVATIKQALEEAFHAGYLHARFSDAVSK